MKYHNWKIIGFDESRSRLFAENNFFAIEVLHARFKQPTNHFLHRWAHLLVDKSPLFRQICAAYCLASTAGDTAWIKYRPDIVSVPCPDLFTSRQWYTEYGIAALPFCHCYPEFATKPEDLHNVQRSFRILESRLTNALSEHKDILHAALIVHRGALTRNPEKLFDISYRGDFLPKFIAFFNMTGIILHERIQNNEPETRAPETP